MANNKIILGEEVLIDLTQDTVTPDSLVEGITAHDASGNVIEGTRKPSFALGELDDVNIKNPKKDDVLGYDPDTDTWINKKGGNDVDLIVVDGKLNQIYNSDGATEDTETTDAIVLDSTARELNNKLDNICNVLNTRSKGVMFKADGKDVKCSIDGTNWKTIVTFD